MAKEEAEKAKKVRQPTAKKRDLQSKRSRLRNKSFRSSIRTAIRKFESVLPSGKPGDIQANLDEVYSLVDKGVKKGVYKLNAASRTKSRLAARAKSGK